MKLEVGGYLIVSGSRPTSFSVYKGKTWITQANLNKGVLEGVEDNPVFDKKTSKAIRKAVIDLIMRL